MGGTQVEHLTHGYDVLNRETSASNSAGSYALTYNKVGDVTYVSEPNSVSLTMTYDKVDNRTQVADSLGGTENSEYDQANRLKNRELIMTGSTPDPYEIFTYDPANQVTGQSRYASKTGTLISTTTNTFDDAGRTKTMLSKDGSNATTQSFSYNYDAKGRVTSQTINGTTTTYSYDVTDQLTADGSTAYTYDNNGNRTISGYSTGSDNRLLSDGTWNYTYDAEGNETQKAKISTSEKWLYAYDHRNQMTKAEHISTGTTVDIRVTYKYDVWGNRVEKTVDPDGDTGSTTVVTSKFAVDGWNPAKNGAIGTSNFDVWADLNGSGSLVTRYMRGDKIDEILARVDLSGAHTGAFWYLNDQLGSIRAVVDNTGVVKDAITYNAFGGITAETDSSYRGRYAWTGREVETETALQYNRARYYDPVVGRWTSKDPMGFDAGDSNLYRYARNAPKNYNDPSGMELLAWDDYTKDEYLDYFKNILKIPGINAVQATSGRWVFTYDLKDEGAIRAIASTTGGNVQTLLEAMISSGATQKNIEIGWSLKDDGSTAWWQRETGLKDSEKSAINAFYSVDYYTTIFSSSDYAKISEAVRRGKGVVSDAAKILNDDVIWEKVQPVLAKGSSIEKQIAANRERYKGIMNRLKKELADNPAEFNQGIPSKSESWWNGISKGGYAYCFGQHEPIFLRDAWFSASETTRLWLLLHEYGRTYFWNDLANTEETIKIGTTGEFDAVLQTFHVRNKGFLSK